MSSERTKASLSVPGEFEGVAAEGLHYELKEILIGEKEWIVAITNASS
jgi:hypothetical protein